MQQPSELLRLGQRIELGVGEEWLVTRVDDHTPDGRLSVVWPTDHERRRARVEVGQTVQLMMVARQDALYATSACVEDLRTNGVPLIALRVDGPWHRMQRRSAVREKVAVRPRLAQAVYGPAKRTLRLGVVNVSATGVQVRSQDEIRQGDLLELAFELEGEVHVQARVRRVYRGERVWEAGCEFEDISNAMAQRIVQFIFAKQRAMLSARRSKS